MSATKDMWMDDVERVGEDFAAERLTRDQAMSRLSQLGFDPQEASDMLDEAVA